jgi:CTP:molybdopterin cytidylyltransferase MocA
MEKNKQLLNQVLQSQLSCLSYQQVQEAICRACDIKHLYQIAFEPTRVVVVAAGKGSRFQGTGPKVLAQGEYGRPLLLRVLDVVAPFDFHPIVVVNHETGPLIQSVVAQDMRHTPCWLFQEYQGGTGDAVLAAEATLAHFHGSLIVVWGDMGALSERLVFAALAIHQLLNAAITLPTKWCNHPYVALIRDSMGTVIDALQEHNGHKMPDCGEQDCGVFIVKSPDLFLWLRNAYSYQQGHTYAGECDFLSLLQSSGKRYKTVFEKCSLVEMSSGLSGQSDKPFQTASKHIYAVCMGALWECQGVNTLQDLIIADNYAQKINQQTIENLAHCQTLSALLDVLTWSTVQMDLWIHVEEALLRLAVDTHSLFKELPRNKRSVIEKWLSAAQKGK